MNFIEEKKRYQKCPRRTPKQRQKGPIHLKGGQKKKKTKITYNPAHDVDQSSIQEGPLKGETYIKIWNKQKSARPWVLEWSGALYSDEHPSYCHKKREHSTK